MAMIGEIFGNRRRAKLPARQRIRREPLVLLDAGQTRPHDESAPSLVNRRAPLGPRLAVAAPAGVPARIPEAEPAPQSAPVQPSADRPAPLPSWRRVARAGGGLAWWACVEAVTALALLLAAAALLAVGLLAWAQFDPESLSMAVRIGVSLADPLIEPGTRGL